MAPSLETLCLSLILEVLAAQEGAGHAVLSAYVEIVFDNSDNRLPVSPFFVLHQAHQNLLKELPLTPMYPKSGSKRVNQHGTIQH